MHLPRHIHWEDALYFEDQLHYISSNPCIYPMKILYFSNMPFAILISFPIPNTG